MDGLVGIFTVTPSSVKNNDKTYDGMDIVAPVDGAGNRPPITQSYKGIIIYLNITAVPGGDTVRLALQEQEPISGTWNTMLQTVAKATTGLVKMVCFPGITEVAATQTAQESGSVLPAKWRIKTVHSAGTDFTYSIAAELFN